MAQLNEILVGRFNRGLQKLFGIKGAPPVSTLAPEVMPVHRIESGSENRYSEGWDRFSAAIFTPATAAQTNGVRIRNPVGSNVIAVVEKVLVTCGVGNEIDISEGTTGVDLTTFGTISLDSRTQRPQSTLIASSSVASPPTLAAVIERLQILANIPWDFVFTVDQELNVLPGQGFQVSQGVVQNALTVTMIWRERFLEEGERL